MSICKLNVDYRELPRDPFGLYQELAEMSDTDHEPIIFAIDYEMIRRNFELDFLPCFYLSAALFQRKGTLN